MSLIRTNLINKTVNCCKTMQNRLMPVIRRYSTKDIENTDTGPIKFTKSPASKWKASTSRTGVKVERLWYEQYVVLGSLSVFLLYFCILRTENDIDEELNKSLYKRIKGLEEAQLIASLKYNESKGLDTEAIIARLEEIKKRN